MIFVAGPLFNSLNLDLLANIRIYIYYMFLFPKSNAKLVIDSNRSKFSKVNYYKKRVFSYGESARTP